MTTTKASSLRLGHRAAGIALAGLLAVNAGAAMAQNLVANGDFTHYVAPTALNPNTGMAYTSFITRNSSTAAVTGGYLNDWTLNSYLNGGGTSTTFGAASQLITGNGNDALFQPVIYPNIAYPTQNNTCCLLAWSYNNIRAQYGSGNQGYTAPPDQINNSWDGRGPNGANYWMTDASWNPMALSQTINGLVVGKQYALNFDWAVGQLVFTNGAGNDAAAGWNIFVGNQAGFTTGLLSIGEQGFSGWKEATYTFIATASSATLTFLPLTGGTPPLAMLSGISVTAVPEPETLLMFGLGLAVLTVVRRRTRR